MKKNGIALAIILIILVMTLVACGENDLDMCVHNVVIDESVSATCTKTGLTEGKHCSKCGKVILAQTEIPALGHTYLDDGSCSICGYQEYIFSLNKDGESYTITGLGEDFEGTALVIPAEYNGKPVTSIGKKAFSRCSSLTSIVIPDSVTRIGDYAFYSCTSLTSVTIGENSKLTTIGLSAFCYCTSLTSIVIPDSVTRIGDYAFEDCIGLTSIVIPDRVTTIGDLAFSDCTSLTNIVIPDSVTTIGDLAFA